MMFDSTSRPTGEPQEEKTVALMGWTALTSALRFLTRSSLMRRGIERIRRMVPQLTAGPDRPVPSPLEAACEATPRLLEKREEDHAPPAPWSDTQSLMDALQRSGKRLTGLCGQTENDFLDLGGRLQTIQAEARQLAQTIVAMLGEEQNASIRGALRAIENHAAGAIDEVKTRRLQLAADLDGLQRIHADLAALHLQNQQFKVVAKNLKMVGLAISIESARSQAATEAFQALAEEIAQLSRTVYSAVGHIGEDTQTAQRVLDTVHADIGARMAHLETLMADAQTSVRRALDQVACFMNLTMDALDRISEQSRQIDQQVGRLVVGVQIHDNISQRAAHIHEALDEAEQILNGTPGVSLPQTSMQAMLGRVYGIVRLQMAQVQTICEDVAAVREESRSALGALQTAVGAVTRAEALDTLEIDAAYPVAGSRARHPVTVLTQELERLTGLFDEGMAQIRRLGEARKETGRTVARMNTHIDQVRDINFDIRLKALNAVIRSSRLGDAGRAIAAIVNEMKVLAEQSNTTVGEVTDIMARIAEASKSMDSAGDDRGGADGAGALLRRGIEGFSIACATFKTESRQVLAMGQRLERRIAEGQTHLGFFDTLADGGRTQLSRLAEVQHRLQPFAEAAPDDWQAEERRIMARYTMDREREAHLGHPDPERDPAPEGLDRSPGTDAAAAEPEMFDDNVELF